MSSLAETLEAPTPVTEIPAILKQVYRMPLAEYERATELGTLPENVELLRGVVVTKMSKSPLHESIISRLHRLLIRRLPDHLMVRLGAPLSLQDSAPEPDLAVVDRREDDWASGHPTSAHLVVEVAVHSVSIDVEKAAIYAAAGLPEYWLVRAQEKAVTVFRDPQPGGYRSVERLSGPAQLSARGFPCASSVEQLF